MTEQVEAMYADADHGFLIRDAAEGRDAEQQFHARDKGQSPPRLVLRFKRGSPFAALSAFDAGLAGVSAFKARAATTGRTVLPPSAFTVYGFTCEQTCSGSTTGNLAATGKPKVAAIPLRPARFKGGPGSPVRVKVSVPAKGVKLVERRRGVRLALLTTLTSGGRAARLPARIRIDARR